MFSQFLSDDPAHLGIAIVVGLLIAATVIVSFISRGDENGQYKELSDRVKSWWIMITIFSFALLSSPTISVIFFGLLSFLAFKEFISIVPLRRADRRVLFWAYLTIPVQYFLVSQGMYGLFIVFIPVWVFFLLPFRMILSGQTDGFLYSVSAISWGLVITVFAVSHVPMLMGLPMNINGEMVIGGASLILFLAVLNQGNDVAQYVWGKMFGKHKIVPSVSPNKTWEGFIGGVLTTTVFSVLLSMILTPFSIPFAIAVGLMLGVTGFIGDVTFSALKRDLRIKDAGSFIPGHGGILDRIDSLSLSAPLFFHMVRYFHYWG